MRILLFPGFPILGLALLSACAKKPKPMGLFAAPVTMAVAVRKDVPVQIEAVGNVEAYKTVSVKAAVAGEIFGVHFKEGEDVKKGELLFTIDPRPFQVDLEKNQANLVKDEAQVKQAEANLARDTAQAKNAQTEVRRYAELVDRGYVSREQYDQVETNASALEATVHADEAARQTARDSLGVDKSAVDSSKLNLQYCYIRSPINGRTGSLLIHQGNLVRANDTPYLVVINQIRPIYLTFAVPQEDLSDIKRYIALGSLKVEAIPASRPDEHAIGKISFIDNAVDSSTGTIKLKGIFKNEDKALWPGEFGNVILTLRTERNAVVIPSQAVQTGQKGSYVYVIKPDMTAEARPVTVDRSSNGESVIKEGLRAGEKVVTDGQLRLAPGMAVLVQNTAANTSAP